MKVFVVVVLFGLGGCAASATAQSLYGTAGWGLTPTAVPQADGTFSLYMARVDKRFVRPTNLCKGFPQVTACDELVYGAVISFLPRLEWYIRLTRHFDTVDFKGADRSSGFMFTALLEGRYTPAVAVGIRDFGGTRNFHATYVVATKTIAFFEGLKTIWSAGHAFDLFDANRLELSDKPFGSVGITVLDRLGLGAEYDTRRVNYAGWIQPIPYVRFSGVLMDQQYLSFNVSAIYRLPTGM